MHIHILGQQDGTGATGLAAALADLGNRATTDVLQGCTVSDAADHGHLLGARWAADPPDAVIASGWLCGLTAQVATRDTGVRVLQRLFAPGRSTQQDRRRLEGALGRGAALTVALCSDDADRLVELGVRRANIRVVPHGVDTALFSDEGPRHESPSGGERRLVVRPGADPASMERLRSLLPVLPRSEVVLLTTQQSRPAATSALRPATIPRGWGHRLRLLDLDETGADSGQRTLPALLRSTDVVVTTGDDEVEIDLAVQAMACGVPVVGRAVGAVADLVADGVTGELVTGATPDALGDAVRSMLHDDLRRESYGLAAGDRARASFGWPTVAAMWARVITEVTAEDAGAPLELLEALDTG